MLVNGAAGAVGTAAVQLAKHDGARVTGVCAERNRDLVTSLGADRVIDYTTEDFAAQATAEYDVIVDCVGNAPFHRVPKACSSQEGALLLVTADLPGLLRAPLLGRRPRQWSPTSWRRPTADGLACA